MCANCDDQGVRLQSEDEVMRINGTCAACNSLSCETLILSVAFFHSKQHDLSRSIMFQLGSTIFKQLNYWFYNRLLLLSNILGNKVFFFNS